MRGELLLIVLLLELVLKDVEFLFEVVHGLVAVLLVLLFEGLVGLEGHDQALDDFGVD